MSRRSVRTGVGFACMVAAIGLAAAYARGAVNGAVLLGALLMGAGVVLVLGGDQ